jgi:PilZ domain
MDVTSSSAVDAVLAQVVCSWADGETPASVVHSGRGMFVLEAADPRTILPPIGTVVQVVGDPPVSGRLAEHGRAGRFLVSLGERPVRRALRLKVSLRGELRSPALSGSPTVEIVDLTAGGARIRGVELPVGTQVTLDFTPPYRQESVSVRGVVAHGTHRGQQPWIGVLFRLVAMRGGR